MYKCCFVRNAIRQDNCTLCLPRKTQWNCLTNAIRINTRIFKGESLFPSKHETIRQYLLHLSFWYSSSVVNDPRGLEASGFVELDEQLSHHVGQVLYDLLAVEQLLGGLLARRLHADRGAVAAGVPVHAAHHGGDGRLLPVPGGRVSDVRAQEDHWLLEHRGPVQQGWGSLNK